MQKLVITLLLLLSTMLISVPAHTQIKYTPIPSSLKALVQTSDAIVVGKLHKVLINKKFYGYQANAEALGQLDNATPLPLGFYRTTLQIKVKQILKGKQQLEDKAVVISLMTPKIITDLTELNRNMLKNQDKIHWQVFFLRQNPDATYGLNTSMGALHLKKATISNTRSKQTINKIVLRMKGKESLPFGLDISASDFYEQVKTIVETKATGTN